MTSTLLLLALPLLALLVLAYWISSLLLYPPRQPVTGTPADCGLAYEAVSFTSADGLALPGWWIPAGGDSPLPAPPAVILLHPLFGSRQGYRPRPELWARLLSAPLDLLAAAQVIQQAGFNLLMFDFRCHGESPRGLCAGGLSEDQDVTGAVDYVFSRLAAETPEAAPQVGLVGFGLGACAAIAAVGREKGGSESIRVFSGDSESATGWTEFLPANVKKLAFLAAVQPASLDGLLRGYLRRFLPVLDRIIVPLVSRMCQRRSGYPLDGTLLLKLAHNVNVPVLFVQPGPQGQSGWAGQSSAAEVQRLYDAVPGPKQLWWLDPSLERMDAHAYVCAHLEPLLAFVAEQPGWQGIHP